MLKKCLRVFFLCSLFLIFTTIPALASEQENDYIVIQEKNITVNNIELILCHLENQYGTSFYAIKPADNSTEMTSDVIAAIRGAKNSDEFLAMQTIPIQPRYTGAYIPYEESSSATGGTYTLHIAGDWYKHSTDCILGLAMNRIIDMENYGSDPRTIQYNERAVFDSIGIGLSISAPPGFSITNQSGTKVVDSGTVNGPNNFPYFYVIDRNEIMSQTSAFTYSHTAEYTVIYRYSANGYASNLTLNSECQM